MSIVVIHPSTVQRCTELAGILAQLLEAEHLPLTADERKVLIKKANDILYGMGKRD